MGIYSSGCLDCLRFLRPGGTEPPEAFLWVPMKEGVFHSRDYTYVRGKLLHTFTTKEQVQKALDDAGYEREYPLEYGELTATTYGSEDDTDLWFRGVRNLDEAFDFVRLKCAGHAQ